MKKTMFLLMILSLLFSGCASVSYLPSNSSVAYSPTDHVEIYWQRPVKPYVELGLISAQSDSLSEEGLYIKLREKAMSIGANGIIMNPPIRQTNYVPIYSPGTSGMLMTSPSGTIYMPSSPGMTTMTPITVRRFEGLAIRFK